MPMSEELSGFVKESLLRGLTRTQIEEVLLRADWKPEQVRSALAGFAEIDFPVPVPRPRSHIPAREAFMYLVLFSTLYITAYNFGSLLFKFIDHAFPIAVTTNATLESLRAATRWSVSSLIVAFPVFLFVSRLTSRMVDRGLSERGSDVRRGLTYATLFLAASLLIGDFIALVYSFLGGELTVRFVLKTLTIGLIGGAIFGYYLRDLRQEEREDRA